jgi:hypothetical protein
MTDKEPERLKATGDTPDELVRALRALGRDRDSERLARVAERLTTTLAATGAPAGSWLQNVLGSKLTLLGIVVGLGALGVLGYQRATTNEAPVEQPAATVPAAPTPIAPQAAPAREPAQASEPAPALSGERERGPRSKRAPRRAASGAAGGQARTAIEATTTTGAQAEADQAHESADEEEAAAPAAPEEPKPAAQAPTEQPASEELLVHRARRAATSEPAAALRLLDEHAERFPNGLLIPEREVLAIEVLRSLGRNAEAEQRLQRFQKRYPQSIHLRRLEQGRAAERDD